MTKQIKVREDNYFAVQGWMVTELKLKGNALMLYAIIYGFSQTTNTAFTGSVDYLCEWLGGVSRPTVINTLDNLVKQGLLTKSKVTTVEKFASTLRDNAGEDPVVALAIVDQSIDKGWKDLYPLKNYGRQGKPTAVSKKFSGNTLKDAEGKDIVFK